MNKLTLILAFVVAFPFIGNAQRKRAFMIGISNYHTNGYKVWSNIHGAEDVALLKPELEKKGFKVQTLINEQATYQGILNALNSFIATSKKGDVVYLHFSCHGQPVEDGLNGLAKDEKDGWDEAIVPIDAGKEYNSSYKGTKHLTDDELNGYISKLRKKIGLKGLLYVAMDACHAGTMSRNGFETVRGTNEGLTKSGIKYNPSKEKVRHFPAMTSKEMSPVLFFEACLSYERNTEIRVNGKEYGALSYNIWQAIKDMGNFDKNTKDKFKANLDASTKIKGRWPRTQTLVIEE
jgi:hypothetical protein